MYTEKAKYIILGFPFKIFYETHLFILYMKPCVRRGAPGCVWRSSDNLRESVLSVACEFWALTLDLC